MMNSLRMFCLSRLSAMELKSSAVILMVSLVSSVVLFSCYESNDEVTGAEAETTYTISGSVEDRNNFKPIAGVTVEITGLYLSDTCVTDQNGKYGFTNVEEGTYYVRSIERPGSEYFFSPDTFSITIVKDVTLSSFSAFKYSQLIIENNSLKTISEIRLSRYIHPQVWTDDILSADLAPSLKSDKIKLKFGVWLMQVVWNEGSEQGVDLIMTDNISPGDSLVFPINSILKVENNSTHTLCSLKMLRIFIFDSGTATVGYGGREMLKNPVLPGTDCEDKFVFPGVYDISLGFCEDSDTNFVKYEDITISAGDTVLFPLE